MKIVKQDEFDSFIRSIPEDDLNLGRDVGRTHGITVYYQAGKLVAEERWYRDTTAQPRIWTYQIAE